MYLILDAVTDAERDHLIELAECRILEVTFRHPTAEICPVQDSKGGWHKKYELHGETQWAEVVGYVGAL